MSGVGMGTFVFNLVSTYLVNPNSENADKNGLFPEDVAENLPRMIRILCACWVGICIVGIALIFPFKPEKEPEKIIEEDTALLRGDFSSVTGYNQTGNINMTTGKIKFLNSLYINQQFQHRPSLNKLS